MRHTPCYLFNGDWYVFDIHYAQLLTREFNEFYDKNKTEADAIKKGRFGGVLFTHHLSDTADTEDDYNKQFYLTPKLIVTHTILMNNVEMSDIIFWNSTTIYLMHNKMKFDGSGVRDLTNQILTAAEYLQKRMSSTERTLFLKEYYSRIAKKYDKNNAPFSISENTFIQMFNDKKIFFIAGYLENFKKSTTSTYSKYLTIELNKKLSLKNYKFLSMAIFD